MKSAPQLGSSRLICIDGPAGSGKTTLAAALREYGGDQVLVLHADDHLNGWHGLEDSWARIANQVLEPLAAGSPARFQIYDWQTGSFGSWTQVNPTAVVVLEGCGAARRASDRWASLQIWVQVNAPVRLWRGIRRDGWAQLPHWFEWMRSERRHFRRENSRARCQVRVFGTMRS